MYSPHYYSPGVCVCVCVCVCVLFKKRRGTFKIFAFSSVFFEKIDSIKVTPTNRKYGSGKKVRAPEL